jgi:hypothetical protein
MQWSLALNKSWCWFGVYCIPTHFQTRGPKVKKWMFLLFVHEEFIFHLILMVFFLMNSLGKYLSAKCIVLLCNYYHSYHEKGPNKGNFLLFYFTSDMMHFFCCKMIILMGYWWAITIFLVFCFLKGTKILNFPIFGGHIEFLFFVQFWWGFFLGIYFLYFLRFRNKLIQIWILLLFIKF